MFELFDSHIPIPVIRVVGIGGGGGNAVNHMVAATIEGVDFISANTDAQALKKTQRAKAIQLGSSITKGLGAGANPDIGRRSAIADRERIRGVLEGTDMVFITAGMGGGTGTGAAPVVADIAKQLGALTIAVVTTPFAFEGNKRRRIAEAGIAELAEQVDALITIPNEKLLAALGKEISLLDAFSAANDILLHATQGIAELVTRPGLINVDFADVKAVMAGMGASMIGRATACGPDRGREAALAAIHSPLLGDVDLGGAKGILVNISAGANLTIGEFDAVGNAVRDFADDDATVVVGTVIDPTLHDELRVTVVATGLGETRSFVQRPGLQEQTPPKRRVRDETADSKRNPEKDQSLVRPAPARWGGVHTPMVEEKDLEYLDIPAFLRRRAD